MYKLSVSIEPILDFGEISETIFTMDVSVSMVHMDMCDKLLNTILFLHVIRRQVFIIKHCYLFMQMY